MLVHGLASNARMWDGVGDELAGRGHDVAAVDLRGHGRSDKPDDGYDYATIADDLVAVADALGWERPVVVGQSWGGNVVVELAARRPGRVGAVAGVDGGTFDLAARFPRWEDCSTAMAPPHLEGTPLAELERRFRAVHPDWPEAGIRGALACFEVREDLTVAPRLTRDRHLRILRSMWERRPRDAYPLVTVPVLLLPVGDTDVAEAEAMLADVRVHRFADADHDVHAQRPAAVAALVAEVAS